MKTKHVVVFGTSLFLFVTMGLAQHGQPVHWRVSGPSHSLGIDSGLEIQEGSIGICAGKGTFGEHTCSTMFRSGPIQSVPPASECVGELTMFTHVQRFPNGDLLYSRLPSGEPLGPNYICMRSDGLGYWGTVTLEFVGGTGKFEGASGWATWEFDGDFLEMDPNMGLVFSAATNEVDGMLYLNGD